MTTLSTLPLHMVPDPDEPDLFLPYVDGAVGGRPYRFLLDTGASQSRVAADEHTAALPVTGTKQSSGAFGVPAQDELVTVSLRLGPIEKADLVVVRTAAEDRPGLIGMDLLGGATLAVDFSRAEARLTPGSALADGWPLRRGGKGHPFLELSFPDVVAHACWDTGAAVTVVDAGFAAAHPDLFTPAGASVGHDSTGASQETPMYRMAAATAGGVTLAEHLAAAVPLPQRPDRMDLVLGYPALCQYAWIMDFAAWRWTATAL